MAVIHPFRFKLIQSYFISIYVCTPYYIFLVFVYFHRLYQNYVLCIELSIDSEEYILCSSSLYVHEKHICNGDCWTDEMA